MFSGHVGSPLPGCKIKVVDVPEMGYFAKDGKGEVINHGNYVCLSLKLAYLWITPL